MANDIYVFIMSKGGIVLKKYGSVGAAKDDVKVMGAAGQLSVAYAFKKFQFKAKLADDVLFHLDDSDFGD